MLAYQMAYYNQNWNIDWGRGQHGIMLDARAKMLPGDAGRFEIFVWHLVLWYVLLVLILMLLLSE